MKEGTGVRVRDQAGECKVFPIRSRNPLKVRLGEG